MANRKITELLSQEDAKLERRRAKYVSWSSVRVWGASWLSGFVADLGRSPALWLSRLKRMLEEEEAIYIREAAESIETPLERQVCTKEGRSPQPPQRFFPAPLISCHHRPTS
jgi:hypothetical protein